MALRYIVIIGSSRSLMSIVITKYQQFANNTNI